MLGSGPDAWRAGLAAVVADPGLDLDRVEAREVAQLDVGNAAFVYEPADVTHVDAET